MNKISFHKITENWLFTKNATKRGYIQPAELRELWFHTGSKCNLHCPFCFEQSSPTSKRIDRLSFKIAKEYIDSSMKLGVKKFCFTGGEPFTNHEIIKILSYALKYRPCLILTNGTTPLHKNFDNIIRLRDKVNLLSFRISIDSVNKEQHDKHRGSGSFDKAIASLEFLSKHNVNTDIAVYIEDTKNLAQKEYNFNLLLNSLKIGLRTKLSFFQDLNHQTNIEISEDCMSKYCSADQRANFMCSYIKMVTVQKSIPVIYPCTLVDDDPDYELNCCLKESLSYRIMLKNKRCYTCFSRGVSCSG